jgi:exodeoxyribonuclease VII large subunit
MLQARKEAMAAAGLFSNDRQLPRIPRSIALVTSPTGAAVRDFLQVIERRRAPVSVRILPTPVQGDDAPPRIARAIRYASRHRLGDVIVVTRGGGSVEDLLAFSDPEVIRAIHEASVPVLSAVGHEIDWALSDYAADLRAPTPSAAAEIVSISREEITTRLSHASFHVREALTARLTSLRQRLSVVEERELRYRFRNLAQPWYQRVDEARTAIRDHYAETFRRVDQRVTLAAERIEGASPLRALERGYAIVRAASGAVVPRAASVGPAEELTVQFSDDSITVRRVTNE